MNTKLKLISTAVAAGLGLGLVSTSAQAVYVNQQGTGQTLLYPYYTTEAGYNTNVNVVNTTDAAKVVKVRFLEAKNSSEVLDFNLYLSAHDEWSGAIVNTADGAKLISNDTSCTAPALPAGGVDFRNIQYSGDSDTSLARTREGYMEIISMGDIASGSSLEAAVTHSAGVPADCGYVTANALNVPLMDGQLTADTGGLYGYGVLINVDRGTAAGYDATALSAFAAPGSNIGYNEPGSLLPSLNNSFTGAVTFDGTTATPSSWSTGTDAVSAVLMASNIFNDYIVDPAIAAATDWVVTFPTKHDLVNTTPVGAPFTAAWDETKSQACEPISVSIYDREEGTTSTPIDFSPKPTSTGASLCYEANAISFNNSDVLGAVAAGGAAYTLTLPSGFTSGWMNLDMTGTGHTLSSADTTPVVFTGLPAIGFAIQQYTNGSVGGLLANYSAIVGHKYAE